MKNLFVIAAALTALTAGTAYADCTFPPPPQKIPDGRTASRQEMLDGQQAVKAYDKAITAYTTCLQQERDNKIAAGGDKLTDQQKGELDRVLVERHNAAIDMLQSIADRFNEQLRIYNGRDKKS
jgi:hypothetical protein